MGGGKLSNFFRLFLGTSVLQTDEKKSAAGRMSFQKLFQNVITEMFSSGFLVFKDLLYQHEIFQITNLWYIIKDQ